MGSGEDFCLKWNDHHSLFFSQAESLCRGSMLTDVTLATSTKTFPAHKLVLSICSSFFRDLFNKPEFSSTGQASLIYLKDVSSDQLEKLLSYMYRGEINVEESDLIKLLQTAKGLGIKGLSEVDDQNAANLGKPPPPKPVHHQQLMSSKPSKKKQRLEPELVKPMPITNLSYNENLVEVADPGDTENGEGLEIVEPKLDEASSHMDIAEEEGDWNEEYAAAAYDEDEGDYEQGTMIPEQSPSKRADSGGQDLPLSCPQCPKTFASTWHLKRHVQTHSKEKRFKCDLCGKFFSRNDNLKSHQKTVHGMFAAGGGAAAPSLILDY